MNKTLFLSWYNLTQLIPVKYLFERILKTNPQIDIVLLGNKTWYNINFIKYNKIILIPKENTYKIFDFDKLFKICEENNITIINKNCVTSLDKYSLNTKWKENNITVPDMYFINHSLQRYSIPDTIFPAIISYNIGHNKYGNHTLIFDNDSIEKWFSLIQTSEVIVTKYVNSTLNNTFIKSRIIRLENNYIDVNTLGNKINWNIHHTTKGTYILYPDCNYFRNNIPHFDDQIKKIFESTNIEFGALDFGICNNEIIPFEITVPFHISYRFYEYTNPEYNNFLSETILNIVDYWTIFLRDLCNIQYDWCKFQYDLIDWIKQNKGFTND